MDRRTLKSKIFAILCFAMITLSLIPLISIMVTIGKAGLPHLNLSLFTQNTPPPGVTGGGLLNAFSGSFMICLIAMAIAIPIGSMVGAFLVMYKHLKITPIIRLLNDILLSMPSILFGLFVYLLLVKTTGHFSALAGGIALSMIALPVVARGVEDLMLTLPPQIKEAGFGLGAQENQVLYLLMCSIKKGFIGTLMLAFARIFGETAPLLFTALSNQFFSINPLAPMANLPVTLYNFAMSPDSNWQSLAFAGAFTMMVFVLVLSIVARSLTQNKGKDE